MTGFPASPSGAFTQAGNMADQLGVSLIEFCEKANQRPSTVYRWKTNQRSYDVTIYGALVAYYEKRIARLKVLAKQKREAKAAARK